MTLLIVLMIVAALLVILILKIRKRRKVSEWLDGWVGGWMGGWMGSVMPFQLLQMWRTLAQLDEMTFFVASQQRSERGITIVKGVSPVVGLIGVMGNWVTPNIQNRGLTIIIMQDSEIIDYN